MTTRQFALLLPLAVALGVTPRAGAQEQFPVSIDVDASRSIGELRPIWRFFGADEPNYAYMKDGRTLLSELGALRPGQVSFRTHNLLTTGDGTPALKWGSTNAYTEDKSGRAVYDWAVVDRIFDTYLARGVRPYVELGFMPEAMSTHPEPYQHDWRPGSGSLYTGWTYPPKDYAKWGTLIEMLVKHCIAKYGVAEVRGWYWETWNEANIGYWHGTREEFFRLHDVTVAAVRKALPDARVGGPDMAGSDREYLSAFLQHVLRDVKPRAPLDFVSFHAKGSPTTVDGHVRMGIANQLSTMARGFETIASFPEAKDLPIVIGESDPEGCAACKGAELAYRNGTMYSSYTAASFARALDLAAKYGVRLEGALTWAFEFEDQGYFPGFRVLASSGVDHPVLNVFRMMSRMPSQRLAVTSSGAVSLDSIVAQGVRGAPDVSAIASRDSNHVAVMAWHYHDDDVAGPDAMVSMGITGLPVRELKTVITHYSIDDTHSNAYAAWKRMGSPIAPNAKQYAELKAAGMLEIKQSPSTVTTRSGTLSIGFPLARQAVELIMIEWTNQPR